jgi:hypothetical protein
MRVGASIPILQIFYIFLILSLVLGRAKQLFRPPAPPMLSMSNFEPRARADISRTTSRSLNARAYSPHAPRDTPNRDEVWWSLWQDVVASC